MDAFISELNELFLLLFGRATAMEMWLLTGVCLLVALVFFKKLAEWMGGKEQFFLKTSLLLLVGTALMASAAAAASVFLSSSWVFQAAAAGILLLVLVVPLGLRIFRVTYLTSVMVWVLTALIVAVILFVEPMVMDSIRSGSDSASGLKLRRIEAEGVLK